MKKLILTSATILCIGLTSFAQDGSKCSKSCEKKCEVKDCSKDPECKKKCAPNENTVSIKCSKDSKSCAKNCKLDDEKKAGIVAPY